MQKATFIKKEQVADSVFSFWFSPEQELPYIPGQFIELTLQHEQTDSRGHKRWFTLSSSPFESHIAITTKQMEKPSSFKQRLFALSPGESVAISDALGDFVLPKRSGRPIVFLLAGIGVTPARSILVSLEKQKTPHDEIYTLLAAKQRSAVPFLDIFKRVTTQTELFLSDTSGSKLTAESVFDALKEEVSANCLFFIAGPERFSENMRDGLLSLGVSSQRLVVDYFHGY